jgi:hypothetical protein
MERTILLGLGNEGFSLKAQRVLYFFLGLMFLLQGAFSFTREAPFSIWNILLTIAQVAGGAVFLFFSFSMLSVSSKFSPKVRLTEELIEFRLGFFQANIVITWENIRAIEIRTYGVNFQLEESERRIDYTASAEISKEIKNAIKELAEKKNIVVDWA